MARSPLFYPLNRSMDVEGGGLADLQTDVMRFMAILALCLVAIFALVQSIPLAPEESKSNAPSSVEIPAPQAPATAPQRLEPTPAAVPEATPASEPVTVSNRSTEASTATAPEPTSAPAGDGVQKVAPEAAPHLAKEGFTLRFESDLALTRLVARNEVGLYALTRDRSLRMSVNRGKISFWAASAPNQFHEMDAATVPEQVVTAVRRAGVFGARDAVKWGVTIPGGMRRQLDQYLREHRGGSLVIGPDAALRLEP